MEKLKHFLEGAVVIPYNENVLEVIDKACHDYCYNENADKFETMECITTYFLVGIEDEAFHTTLNAAVAKEGTLASLPNSVVQRLAGYSCYFMVMEEDDEKDCSILASIFMNYMLLVKKRTNRIPCSTLIQELYGKHISNYIKKTDSLDDTGELTLIRKIAESDSPLSDFKEMEDEDEMDDQFKRIAKSAAFYEYQKVLRHDDLRTIADPFVRVFVALCKLMCKMEYYYYDFPFYSSTMHLLSEDESKTRKSVQKITESLKPYAKDYIKELYSGSSLLLRKTKGETDICLNDISTIQLSVKEFCIYLYYELLIDNILNQIYDEE